MTRKTPFGSEEVITQHISEADIKTYFVGFDFGRYRYDELIDLILDVIVDFAFGFHKGILSNSYNRRILVEAAKSIYGIKTQTPNGEKGIFEEVKKVYVDKDSELPDDTEEKYLKRGEFGEVILHLLLRDFIETVPLISKIHFKDADGITVHGFDAVHIGPSVLNHSERSLYLGESKLYNCGKTGVRAHIPHFNILKPVFSYFRKAMNRSNKSFHAFASRSYVHIIPPIPPFVLI